MVNIWLITLMLFFFLELVTIGLVSIWFCIGTVCALVLAYYGIPPHIQVIAFALVSFSLLGCMVSFRKRFLRTEKTNAQALIGETCIVTEKIENKKGLGAVYVKGQYWSALSENKRKIDAGTEVEITGIEGVHLIVKKVKRKKEE